MTTLCNVQNYHTPYALRPRLETRSILNCNDKINMKKYIQNRSLVQQVFGIPK